MIVKIWYKIAAIIILLTLPLMGIQYFLNKQSIELAFQMVDNNQVNETLDNYLNTLKSTAVLDPQHRDKYKDQFRKVLTTKQALNDFGLLRNQLVKNIMVQTLWWTSFILLFFLAMAFLFSKSIVTQFNKLLEKIKKDAQKLEALHGIESWQRTAQIMVHELKAPLTPLKLISTSIVDQHNSLPKEDFSKYLNTASEVLKKKISIMEETFASFTHFSKLPKVQIKPNDIRSFIHKFFDNYKDYKKEYVSLKLLNTNLTKNIVPFDENLINNLLFNLIKNAHEANKLNKIEISISLKEAPDVVYIQVHNTGNIVPRDIEKNIFNLYVSTKSNKLKNKLNLGLGLTICKKIALDHGGDLILVENSTQKGVTFEFNLPYNKN